MKKSAYILLVAIAMTASLSTFTSCRDQKTTGDKIEDVADDVGDGIEDAADDVEDAVD
ncbi:hypothetical protein [Formosa algae]|uniref:Entericidin n=1 Tax=Formosa algae TaxID=225843 RepID=A0A9X1C8L3_9FLAO|nr:hypothetical protein [Formosa algae]MBP1839446.1 hypothetical protein [Formosa algae]MDQ0334750.1 hypothetical protein [Formosa algae]